MGLIKPQQFEVWLTNLDPTIGHEIKKTRPAVIIAPDELRLLKTTIIAPLTSQGFGFPCRVKCRFQNRSGLILLDHVRSIDKRRLIKKLGGLNITTATKISDVLVKMFTLA